MKRFIIILFFSFIDLSVNAQISPIFQTHPMKFDIPAFNPAFAGDSESAGFRVITNFGALKTNVSDELDYSTYLGIDGKIPIKNTTSFFTIGTTFNFNSYAVEGNLGALSNEKDKFRFDYGFSEIFFGLRLPTRFTKKIVQKRATQNGSEENNKVFKRKNDLGLKVFNKSNKPEIKNYDSFINLNKTAQCSMESVSDFIAFNMLFGTDIIQLRGIEGGAIFGDQIQFNDLDANSNANFQAYNIAGRSNDPLAQLNVNQEFTPYIGVGLLYHFFWNRTYLLRFGATVKSLIRNYTGLPQANQVGSPLKILQVSGYNTIGAKNTLGLHIMYLDQNPKHYPQFKEPINQWRFGANLGFKTRGAVERVEMSDKMAYESTDAGISVNVLKGGNYIMSPFLGFKVRTNSNFTSNKYKNGSGGSFNKKNYSGSIFTLTINYDVYLGNLSNRDLGGNYRLGIIWQEWSNVR